METKGDQAVQREMPFMALIRDPHKADLSFIGLASWVGVLRYCIQRTGMGDYEVADKLHISHGYMSKVLKGTAGLHGERLVRFMAITQCIAPSQWIAHHTGCDLTMRDPAQARIQQLERELEDARRLAA